MADDEFDIDIYGDTATEDGPFKKDDEGDVKIDGVDAAPEPPAEEATNGHNGMKDEEDDGFVDIKVINNHEPITNHQQIKSTDESGLNALKIPKQAPQQQGVKRKEGAEERLIDAGATTAILISELHWWNTDDDVRGWVNQAQVEDELKEITFSEHKVNGKSKGQAYVEFISQGAATATKHKIDEFGQGQQYAKKVTVTYSNPNINPFRTLPKDAPARAGKDGPSNRGGLSMNSERGGQNGGFGGNFRGRTPGYNARGGMNNNMNNFNNNRNFSGPAMGNMGGGFNPAMGGFSNNAMGGQFGGGYNRGGGMMGGMRGNMRGGRGGMGNGMMGGMPMAGMPMGGMPGMGGMPMNMGQMGGGMQGTNNSKSVPVYPRYDLQGGKAYPASTGQMIPNIPFTHQYGVSARVSPVYLPPSYPPHNITQAEIQATPTGGGGFQGLQPHFNPAFFQQNQAGGGDWQNPHGAKRARPE